MPIPKETQDKMDELDVRISEARTDQKNNDITYIDDTEASPDAEKSARAGSEFLSTVFAGAFLGYGLDWYFQTMPLGIISFITLGFISGVMRANAAMKKNSEKNDE